MKYSFKDLRNSRLIPEGNNQEPYRVAKTFVNEMIFTFFSFSHKCSILVLMVKRSTVCYHYKCTFQFYFLVGTQQSVWNMKMYHFWYTMDNLNCDNIPLVVHIDHFEIWQYTTGDTQRTICDKTLYHWHWYTLVYLKYEYIPLVIVNVIARLEYNSRTTIPQFIAFNHWRYTLVYLKQRG